jgi:hypothetical protein
VTRRSVLSVICLLNSCLLAVPHGSGAIVSRAATFEAVKVKRHPAHVPPSVPRCRRSVRSVPALPAPRATFEAPYVPRGCDPMRLLPKQAWRMFACVRWREGGDTPNQPNGAGMYQFTNRATWNEFRGKFAAVPSNATALEQDIVAYRAWKTEQFLPWNGDPCLGSVRQYGKWGWY